MKTSGKYAVLFLIVISMACSGGSTDDDSPISGNDLGSFEGSFQVTDDPQTELGYIFNSRADFKKAGDKFTMTVSGDGGFNRTYEGQIDGEGANSSFIMSLERQTSPEDKTAAGTIALDNASVSIVIMLANDAVTLKETVDDATNFELAGKLRISGGFIRSE